MMKQELWQMFLETGAPEAYVLFSKARRMEDTDVPDNQRIGASGDGLQ